VVHNGSCDERGFGGAPVPLQPGGRDREARPTEGRGEDRRVRHPCEEAPLHAPGAGAARRVGGDGAVDEEPRPVVPVDEPGDYVQYMQRLEPKIPHSTAAGRRSRRPAG
jgi:hypothetical protein